MSRPIRAFLMVRHGVGEWTASVCRDLEAVEDAWKALDRGQTGVLHIGFDRPASAAFEQVAAPHSGRLLITAAAKFGLPLGTIVSEAPVGTVEGIPVHLALQGWGYILDDPNTPTPPPETSRAAALVEPRGWVAKFLATRPDFASEFEQVGVFDEQSYQSAEHLLNQEARYRSGLFRLKSLTEGDDWNPCAIAAAAPPWFACRKLESMALTVRVENVLQRANIQTVADLAKLDFADLLRMPNFGRKSAKDLRTSLLASLHDGSLNGSLEVGDSGSNSRGQSHSISETLLINLHGTIARLNDRERDVLTRRMGLGRSPETLEAISKDYSVTRERIRQIEAKAIKRIIKEEDWDDLLSAKLEKLLIGREFPLPILGIEAVDDWFKGISRDAGALRYILTNFCGDHIGIAKVDGVEYLGFLSQSDWDRALFEARRTLQYGAEQNWTEAHCKAVVTPILGEKTREFRSLLWEKAVETCHFAIGPDGERTLVRHGRGVDSIVEAVLSEAHRPLHYSEIAERTSERAGRSVDVGATRNAAASIAILLGRGIYGLEKHIILSGEEKEFVRQEAEALLLAGPAGRQWHAAEILAALLEADISPEGLDAYVIDFLLRSVETVRRLGRMTWVVAQSGYETAADRIDIRRAVVAFVQEAGQPLSLSEIKQRLVAVRGISQNLQINPIDPLVRIGAGLWGLNDRDVPIKRPDQPRLADDVVGVLQRRETGLHISEIEGEIGFKWPGVSPNLLFALAALDARLRVSAGQYIYLDEWGAPRREALYEILDRVLANADQPMTFEQIVENAEIEIGREPNRKQVTACLQALGAFDPATRLWSLQSSEEESRA